MPDPINTSSFPGDDISPEAITTAAASIRFVGSGLSTQSATVLSTWQTISASYEAPESGSLLHAMDPVKKSGETFGTDLGKAATALETFAEEAREIKKTLAAIRTEANAFLADIKDGVKKTKIIAHGSTTETVPWNEDDATREKNNALIAQVDAQQVLLWAAERKCANAIYDLIGHAHVESVSGNNPNGYGFDQIPAGAQRDWGMPTDRPESCGEQTFDVAKRFVWDGAIVGIVGGTVQGLGALTGTNISTWEPWKWEFGNWELAGAAWNGVGQTVVGLSLVANPVSFPLALGMSFVPGPAGDPYRYGMKGLENFGKGFVAWDRWAEDPVAAAGETVGNIALTIGTLGAGTAVKGGAGAARSGVRGALESTVRAAGKVADLTDPVYLASLAAKQMGKAAGLSLDALKALGNVADVAKNVDFDLPNTKIEIDLPSTDKDSIITDRSNTGNETSDAPPPREYTDDPGPSTRNDSPSEAPANDREPVSVGADSRNGSDPGPGPHPGSDHGDSGPGSSRGGDDAADAPPAADQGSSSDTPPATDRSDQPTSTDHTSHDQPTTTDHTSHDQTTTTDHTTADHSTDHTSHDQPTTTDHHTDHQPGTERPRLEVPDDYRDLTRHDLDSGSKGDWTKELHKPEPNSVYVVDDRHLFVTDDRGRVVHVESTLDIHASDRNTYQQGAAGREFRLEIDHGGHLVATRFGGPGEGINLVAMSKELNGAGKNNWWAMENEWGTTLKANPNAEIKIRIDLDYPGVSKRPSDFYVEYNVDGGPTEIREFDQ